jgi:hypothetical protein
MNDDSEVLADYVGEDELARQLKKSLRTLQRERRALRGPPYVLIGRFIYYKRSSVRDWLDQREIHPRVQKKRRAA